MTSWLLRRLSAGGVPGGTADALPQLAATKRGADGVAKQHIFARHTLVSASYNHILPSLPMTHNGQALPSLRAARRAHAAAHGMAPTGGRGRGGAAVIRA